MDDTCAGDHWRQMRMSGLLASALETASSAHILSGRPCANSLLWGLALWQRQLQQNWGHFGLPFKLGGHILKLLQLH